MAAEAAPGVVEALRRRAGRAAPFDDGLKIALVAEGGAMRGVVAGGMVSAIERLGLAGCFDLMVGSSAGACALAYLRAGQARYGTRIFYEDINNPRFISRARALRRGRPVADIDFLVDEVFSVAKRLDLAALARPGPALYATATDVDRAETCLMTGFDDPARALEILRATARMPLVSGPPVRIDGRRLLDGGMLAHIPVAQAVGLGATHVLVILTKPFQTGRRRRPDWGDRHLVPAFLTMAHGRRLATAVRSEEEDYEHIRWTLAHGEVEIAGARVVACAPSASIGLISREERRATRLIAAAEDADARMSALLEGRATG